MDTIRLEVEAAARLGFALKIYVNDVDITVERSYMGMDPKTLWTRENRLLPTTPAQRVAYARCSCGEAGCGALYATIAESDGVVRWHIANAPGFTFGSAAYRAEVVRAQHDIAWEPPGYTATRLLKNMVPPSSWKAKRTQLSLAWSSTAESWVTVPSTEPKMFVVSLWYKTYQIFLRLPWENSTPIEMAQRAYDLMAAGPSSWHAEWRSTTRSLREVPPEIAGPHWTRYEFKKAVAPPAL